MLVQQSAHSLVQLKYICRVERKAFKTFLNTTNDISFDDRRKCKANNTTYNISFDDRKEHRNAKYTI